MENPQLYSSSHKLQKNDAEMVLLEFLPNLFWNEEEITVLDIGCGTGDITQDLLLPSIPGNKIQIVAIDNSNEMIKHASKYHSDNAIQYQQHDILDSPDALMPFTEGFTKVMSFYCLHWIQDQEKCLQNIYSLLQESGQALLVFLGNNPLFDAYEKISQTPRWGKYMKDVSNFIPPQHYKKKAAQEFADLAETIGFEVNVCDEIERVYSFPNANMLKNAIAAVNPFIDRIPEEDKNQYLFDCFIEVGIACGRTATSTLNPEAKYKLMVVILQKPYN